MAQLCEPRVSTCSKDWLPWAASRRCGRCGDWRAGCGELFVDGTVDEVVMVYSHFLGGDTRGGGLPQAAAHHGHRAEAGGDAIFEPEPGQCSWAG